MYSSKRRKGFPLGIRMCLVPEIGDMSSSNKKAKVESIRYKQKGFFANLRVTSTEDFASLDHQDEVLQKSLRDLIMDIKAPGYPHTSLFHFVEDHWEGGGTRHIVGYNPAFEKEASAMLMGLPVYLKEQTPGPLRALRLRCRTYWQNCYPYPL